MRIITRIAPDIGWLPISFVNVYFIGRPGGAWTLVDAGLPGRANQILDAAEARFGAGARPEAILLTHGHWDHAGSALDLAEAWDVPIYAHRLETPYLTGKSDYPPPDPTVGGAMAFLSRFMPSHARDFGERVRELYSNEVPGAAGWEWLATPGHSPGHISFFRPSDRVLLAGDAFATMNMDSWSGLVTGKRTLWRAGAPFNTDWDATRLSVKELAKLRPNVVGCGHGIPKCDVELPAQLERFAERFRAPRTGRYVRRPARTDERGVISLPPAPFDPIPFATAGTLILAGIALGAGYLDDKRRR
jgi:glyoxylase-like metal-dependent hydrolase (beta-lactamase superfamily II)